MAEPKEYKKLPGRGRRFLSHQFLYLGLDHLLVVNRSSHQENYKRFYFKDIQSIIARKTHTGKIGNAFIGIMAALTAVLAFISGSGALEPLLVVCGAFLVILAANTINGPTCQTHIKTAVQTEKLPSLIRFRMVNKMLKRIRPKIEEAQGVMDKSAIEEAWTSFAESPAQQHQIRPAKHESGLFHKILFTLVLVDGLNAALSYTNGNIFSTIVGTILAVAIGAAVIVALVRQHGSDLLPGIQNLTWLTLGYAVVNFFVRSLVYLAVMMDNPDIFNNQIAVWRKTAEISPADNPTWGGVWLVLIIAATVFSVLGLILTMRPTSNRKKSNQTEAQ